jgi:hypothetical protein
MLTKTSQNNINLKPVLGKSQASQLGFFACEALKAGFFYGVANG